MFIISDITHHKCFSKLFYSSKRINHVLFILYAHIVTCIRAHNAAGNNNIKYKSILKKTFLMHNFTVGEILIPTLCP